MGRRVKTWIAFLRGINVGGSKVLSMKELTALLERNGCSDVKTYIQSGNVVFRSSMSEASRVEEHIRSVVSGRHGFEPRVLVLNRMELERAVASNPFPDAEADPKTLHLFFLSDPPTSPDIKSLSGTKSKSESFALKGKVFYLHTPDGFGKSKLAERVERSLGVDATARNWRTVSTVLELARTYQ
jgi:uncharacterized protein (DUF1697 family)